MLSPREPASVNYIKASWDYLSWTAPVTQNAPTATAIVTEQLEPPFDTDIIEDISMNMHSAYLWDESANDMVALDVPESILGIRDVNSSISELLQDESLVNEEDSDTVSSTGSGISNLTNENPDDDIVSTEPSDSQFHILHKSNENGNLPGYYFKFTTKKPVRECRGCKEHFDITQYLTSHAQFQAYVKHCVNCDKYIRLGE